ncbi:hypothetical protein PM082_007133 [Marasmius tenuissimus]|nr:hypothetical protein PM082_007133 [Marasmius tenuissimus]
MNKRLIKLTMGVMTTHKIRTKNVARIYQSTRLLRQQHLRSLRLPRACESIQKISESEPNKMKLNVVNDAVVDMAVVTKDKQVGLLSKTINSSRQVHSAPVSTVSAKYSGSAAHRFQAGVIGRFTRYEGQLDGGVTRRFLVFARRPKFEAP